MRLSVPILLALVTVASGCRVTMQREALERELREQEDRIYYLEDQLLQTESALEASREQNAELLRTGGSDDYAPREIIDPAPTRSPSVSGSSGSPRPTIGPPSQSSPGSPGGNSSIRPMPPGERPTLDPVDPPPAVVAPPVQVQPPAGLEDPSARPSPPTRRP